MTYFIKKGLGVGYLCGGRGVGGYNPGEASREILDHLIPMQCKWMIVVK